MAESAPVAVRVCHCSTGGPTQTAPGEFERAKKVLLPGKSMPKASGSTQTGDRQDGKGSDSSVVPVRRKYNVKGMPEHIKEMARYATLAFDALNRSKFKTFCIAKAKEFGTTEKKYAERYQSIETMSARAR